MDNTVLDAPRAKAARNINIVSDSDRAILVPGHGPIRTGYLVKKQHANRLHRTIGRRASENSQRTRAGDEFQYNLWEIKPASTRRIRNEFVEAIAQRSNKRLGGGLFYNRDAVRFKPANVHPHIHIALTMVSVIFFASPSSIMVLSR